MLLINYKAYSQAIGKKAEEITHKIEKADGNVAIAPQTSDLNRIETELDKFSQHIDPVDTGSHTGSNQAEAIKQSGASGTLINHSEMRISKERIERTVKKCREKDLTSVICAQTPDECRKYSKFNPDYVAFEPPELIGGEKAVSTAEPKLISKAVKKSSTKVMAGAGIKTAKDVDKAVKLGCKGVLVASGVIKSEDITDKVEELCSGL